MVLVGIERGRASSRSVLLPWLVAISASRAVVGRLRRGWPQARRTWPLVVTRPPQTSMGLGLQHRSIFTQHPLPSYSILDVPAVHHHHPDERRVSPLQQHTGERAVSPRTARISAEPTKTRAREARPRPRKCWAPVGRVKRPVKRWDRGVKMGRAGWTGRAGRLGRSCLSRSGPSRQCPGESVVCILLKLIGHNFRA